MEVLAASKVVGCERIGAGDDGEVKAEGAVEGRGGGYNLASCVRSDLSGCVSGQLTSHVTVFHELKRMRLSELLPVPFTDPSSRVSLPVASKSSGSAACWSAVQLQPSSAPPGGVQSPRCSSAGHSAQFGRSGLDTNQPGFVGLRVVLGKWLRFPGLRR